MPKFLENKLKREYGANSSIPYKVMNKLGAMRGNKETAKGRAMERQHEMQERSGYKGSAANYKFSRKRKVLKRSF